MSRRAINSKSSANSISAISEAMKAMGENLATLTALLQANANNGGGNGNMGTGTGLVARPENQLYKRFKEMDPPEFEGTEGVLYATEWIRQLEKIFEVLVCTDLEKVRLAAFSMKKEAGFWWEDKKKANPAAATTWTWDEFVKQFESKYLPSYAKNDLRVQFYQLNQGTMTVDQYGAKFMELSRYAPEVVKTEELKVNKFVDGLNPYLYSKVVTHRHTSYEAALATALLAEKADKAIVAARNQNQNKRPGGQNGQNALKKQNQGSEGKSKKPLMACTTCGKFH